MSEHRCSVSKKCSGCQLSNLSYEQQLGLKQRTVIRLLGEFCHVDEIIGMEYPWHYRNKVHAAFGQTRGGKVISGVWQSKQQKIVAVNDCLIEDRKADEIIITVRKLLNAFKLSAYNSYTGQGFLRHVLVRRAFTTNEILVSLTAAHPRFTSKNNFVKALLRAHPEITTVVFSVNTDQKALMPGKNEVVLHGNGYITDELCGSKFKITANSFYQINPVQTEVLYNKAIEFAGLTGAERVIDAYCGVGTIGITAGKHAGEVLGVELNGEAVKNAIENSKLNDIRNVRFFKDDAGKFMERMAAEGKGADVVFMDPPRAGSSAKFLAAMTKLSPKKIVYISCSPETQRRDLLFLTKRGYRVRRIQPVDMFPHTNHIETVVLLSREKVDGHIRFPSVQRI